MQKPLLSVIISAFEQPRSLALLLCSLNAQDFADTFEVIVCDDGSSSAHVEEFANRLPKLRLDLRYVWQSNLGYRAARSKNNGIRCAQGQYLLFLDADIIVKPDFLRAHIAAHTEGRLLVCNPRRWLLEPAEPLISATIENNNLPDVQSFLASVEMRSVEVDRDHQRHCFRSSAPWRACLGFSFSVPNDPIVLFDEEFEGWGPEDRELALRLASQHGYSVRYCDEIEVFHLESFSTGRPPISTGLESTVLPKRHDQIVAFFRNVTYFARKHSQADLNELLKTLLPYKLHSETNRWSYDDFLTVHSDPSAQLEMIVNQRRFIETWLEKEKVAEKEQTESPVTIGTVSTGRHSQLPRSSVV